jgi:group I intron endonuclease
MKKLNCGIYRILNIVTGDFYLGQTIGLSSRRKSHFSKLKMGKHRNRYLQKAYDKYGKESFIFEILLYCEPLELIRYEQELVDRLKPEYNICTECVNSRKGVTTSDETKHRISEAKKGKQTWLGKHHSSEAKLKMSAWQIGRKLPKETLEKLSKIRMGSKHSDETKEKMSKARKEYWEKIKSGKLDG